MRAVIVGAGIGGLAAAVALRRVGIESVVLERFESVREVGAGLSLWSNAVNALRELGLDASTIAYGSVVERIQVQTNPGRPIARNEFGAISDRAGAPCICIHRAALQKLLIDSLPSASVRNGTTCVGFEGSSAILESGERVEGDVLVGADGINSVIREGLHGAKTPRYAGYTCWRGIAPDPGVLPDRSALVAVGAGSQFGLWPCGAGQVYWFLTKNAPAGTRQKKSEALELCREWAAPIPEIVERTLEDAIVQNDILDRPPLRWWGRGAVTLLGDAAHACTPNLGQGACQALEDAVILAHLLSGGQTVYAALREYERLRIPRTTRIALESRRSGKVFQLDSPGLESARNWLMGTWVSTYLGTRLFDSLLTYRVPTLG